MKRAIVLSIVGLIVLTIISLFTLTGTISRYAVKTLFEKQQLTLSDATHVSYDPFENSLTLKDFSILHQQANSLLSMKELFIEFDIFPLFNNHLIVNRFELAGLSTSISQDVNNPGAWKLNGWSTANLSSDEVATSQSPQESEQEPSEPKPFKVTIKELQFSDIDVSAELPQQSHDVLLNSMSLLDFELLLDESKQPQSLNFGLTIDVKTNNQLTLEQAQPPVSINADIELSLQPEVTFTDKAIKIQNNEIIDLNLANVNIEHAEQDVAASLNNLLLSLESLDLILPAGESGTTKLKTRLTTNIEQILVNNHQKSVALLELQNAQLNPTRVTFEQSSNQATPTYSVETDEFQLTQLTVMKYSDENKPTLSSLDKLVVSNLTMSESGISVDLIQIGKSTNNLLIDEAKQLANLYLPGKQVEASPNNQTEKPDATQPEVQASEQNQKPEPTDSNPIDKTTNVSKTNYDLRVKELTNVGPIMVNTVDMSVSPIYRSLVEVSHINLQNLDSKSPDQTTTINLNATNNKYAKINVSSQSKPFIPEPTHDIQLTLDEVDLSAISPYVSSALGYHINSGQLDSKVTAKVINQEVDGNADLLIRSIDLTAISDQGEESSISTGAISFNYALSMLKDGDGNVDLSVPFSGDLNNPSVGFSGFMSLIVKRATMAAAKDYLINTFVPYANVVNFALSASKHILKLRFNDLAFEPKQVSLTTSQQDIVEQLALVLEKHDSVSIKLCPISTVTDLELTDDIETPTAKSITTGQVSKLLELAQNRADNVKQALVATQKVPSKRLLFCSPTIKYGESDKPKVTFEQLN